MANDLTLSSLKTALPGTLKNTVTQELVDKLNTLGQDPDLRQVYRENFISYSRVLQDGRYTVEQYLSAIKYVTHKLMNDSNVEAYAKTFPDRMAKFAQKGTSSKDISSYVAAYNKTKLVNAVREQAMIPVSILNADYLQEAINKSVQLMSDPQASKAVQQKAAESLMNHLKPPENKVELEISHKQDSVVDQLHKTISDLAAKQKEQIDLGHVKAKEVAESKIIEGEVEEDPNAVG